LQEKHACAPQSKSKAETLWAQAWNSHKPKYWLELMVRSVRRSDE
jgi:hypothetical protein